MIIPFMIYAVTIGIALAMAGRLLEARAVLRDRPRRWVWAAMLTATMLLAAAMPWRGAPAHAPAGIATANGSVTAALSSPQGNAWAAVLDAVRDRTNAAVGALTRFDTIARWLWLLGSFALTIAYAVGRVTLRRLRRQWRETMVQGRPVLVSANTGPAVVGAWSPRIVIPTWVLDLDPDQIDLLLRHELEHQRTHDARLLHLAGMVLLLMPWNPAVWWIVLRLRLAIEVDCDARVIGTSTVHTNSAPLREAYGELLLAVAARTLARPSPFTPALLEHPSALNRRISAMYPAQPRLRKLRVIATSVFALGLVTATLAAPVPVPAAQTRTDQGPYEAGTKGLVLPRPTNRVKPSYTPEAMRQRIQGTVRISAVVTKDGTIAETRITQSLDKTYGLDDQALAAAKRWMFEPGRLNGQAVPVRVTLDLDFRLRRDAE